MKTSTFKLIKRLKKLIAGTAAHNQACRENERTPVAQRPHPMVALTDRATLLCATRAAMRGKVHRVEWTQQTQQEWIAKQLTKAEPWFKATIEAALASIPAEAAHRESHGRRKAQHGVVKVA